MIYAARSIAMYNGFFVSGAAKIKCFYAWTMLKNQQKIVQNHEAAASCFGENREIAEEQSTNLQIFLQVSDACVIMKDVY